MGKTVFLKIASVLCFFVSGTVSGSIKSNLGAFWFLFFSLCMERIHRGKRRGTKNHLNRSGGKIMSSKAFFFVTGNFCSWSMCYFLHTGNCKKR